MAETQEQVRQRLERYRQHDEAVERRKAEQKEAAERRRQQTLQLQERRRREEYARRWKCYGNEEIDVLQWRKQKDGTWVTSVKTASGDLPCTHTLGRSRMILGLKPDASGGLGWPDPPDFDHGKDNTPKGSPHQLIGVSCSSLMVIRKAAYGSWSSWKRPRAGETDERLVMDRCATQTPPLRLAWRINRSGVLELLTPPTTNIQAFYEEGHGVFGPRVLLELPGAPSHSRSMRGNGAIREVQVKGMSDNTTRLVVEFMPSTKIDPSQLRVVGTSANRWQLDLGSGISGLDPFGEGDIDATP